MSYFGPGRMCSWKWSPTPAQLERFNEWKSICVGYLVSCKEGVNIRGIPKYLAEETGESPPLTEMGFRTINQFLYEMNNRDGSVDFRTLDGQYFAFIRDSAVPSYLAHIRKEVLGQNKDKSCKGKNGQIRRPTRAQSDPVRPTAIIEAVQGIISIPEDRYQPREPTPIVSRPKPTRRYRQRAVTSTPKTTLPRKTLPVTRSPSITRTAMSSQPQRPSVAIPRLVSRQISIAPSRPVLKPSPVAAKQPQSSEGVKTRLQQALARLKQEACEDKENKLETTESAASSVIQTNTSPNGRLNGTSAPSAVKTAPFRTLADDLNWTSYQSDDNGRMPGPTEMVAKPVAPKMAVPSPDEVIRIRQELIAKLKPEVKTMESSLNAPRSTETSSSAPARLPSSVSPRFGPMRVTMDVMYTLDQVISSPSRSDACVELWDGSRDEFDQFFEQLYRGGDSKKNLRV